MVAPSRDPTQRDRARWLAGCAKTDADCSRRRCHNGRAPLTQLAECRPFKSVVPGSSPGGRTDSVRRRCEHTFVREPPVPPTPIVKKSGRPVSSNTTAQPRECRRHGVIEHYLFSRGDGRFVYRCKRCVGEAVTRRHQKIRRTLIAEAGGSCRVCGYDRCIVNLHFHHVDPTKKSFNVNPSSGKSLAAYRAEAAKCVLVCANCHGEIEAGLTPCPPLRTAYSRSP